MYKLLLDHATKDTTLPKSVAASDARSTALKLEAELCAKSESRTYQSNAASMLVKIKYKKHVVPEEKRDTVASLNALTKKHSLSKTSLESFDFPRDCATDAARTSDDGTSPVVRKCHRCSAHFLPMPLASLKEKELHACRYHTGKVQRGETVIGLGRDRYEKWFSCCQGDLEAAGCFSGSIFCFTRICIH